MERIEGKTAPNKPWAISRVAVLTEMREEVERAKVHGAKFASLHEAYAVILEELDEVWEIARQKRRDRDPVALYKELIQLGAMAVKAIDSMENFVGGTV
ncbi:MAG TPA: hypothetical protein VF392_00445 [Terracidiphilus sp.]